MNKINISLLPFLLILSSLVSFFSAVGLETGWKFKECVLIGGFKQPYKAKGNKKT